MGLFETIVGGAVGFMFGGPLGAAGGALIANSFSGDDSNYKITCPHCHKTIGVNSYGRYECCHCRESLEFSESGVIKDEKIDVICPHCSQGVVIDAPGRWTCCHCQEAFEYGMENCADNTEDPSISVTCPHCHEGLVIGSEGRWNCCECSGVFEYSNGKVTKILQDLEEENTYIFIIFAAFAKFCKANGAIKKEHINALENIIGEYYELEGEDRELAIKHFRTGRESSNTFDDYINRLNDACDDNDADDIGIKNGFIDCLYKIAVSTGRITENEEKYINFAVGMLKIEPHILNRIKEEYLNNSLDKYYEILGCNRGDSIQTIKSSYRKIVSECHPDRVSNKDIPEYLVKYSTERFCQVQEAYEKIIASIEG